MRRALSAFLAVALAAFSTLVAVPAVEAGSPWRTMRDAAMQLRERGRAQDAYTVTVAATPATQAEFVDQQFVAGFLSLRALNQPGAALTHFQAMALGVSKLPAGRQNESRAQAGYWLGRTLGILKRDAESKQFFSIAASYRDTFYGLMSASTAGISDTSSIATAYAGAYPKMNLYWHDPRVRQELVLAVIKAESGFRATAVSTAGAKGMMQVMDGTAQRIGRSAGINIDLGQMARNPHYNIAVGSKYIGDLLARYQGNVLLTAAGYNAGEMRSDEWIRRFGDPRTGVVDPIDWVELIPFNETRGYVKKVVANYVTYIALASAK